MYARSRNGHAVSTQGTEADERLREHAQHVLGVPIFFNALMAWDRIPLLPLSGHVRSKGYPFVPRKKIPPA